MRFERIVGGKGGAIGVKRLPATLPNQVESAEDGRHLQEKQRPCAAELEHDEWQARVHRGPHVVAVDGEPTGVEPES